MKKLIIAIIFVLIAPLNVLADNALCSEQNKYCYEWRVGVEQWVAGYDGQTTSIANTVINSIDHCIQMESSGADSIISNGDDIYNYYYRVKIDDGAFGGWIYAGVSASNPGNPLAMISPDQYSIDACSDVRPEPCQTEIAQADFECGPGNWTWTNEENCEWACKACIDEQAQLDLDCGDLGFEINLETCEGYCNPVPDCNDEYLEKLAECGDAGIKEWNNEQCVGSCNAKKDCVETDPCKDYSDNCYNQKCDLYGVESMDCKSSEDEDGCWTVTSQECNCNDNSSNCTEYRNIAENSCGGSNQIESYYCNDEDFDNRFYHCAEPPPDPNNPKPDDTEDGEDPNDPGGSNPPGDPNDPNNQPAPDPVDDPEATEDQKQNTRLDALKANSDTLIDQNNVQIGQLGDIVNNSKTTATNTAIIANNQGILQDELRVISKTNKSGFKDVKEAIEGIDLPDEIDVQHDLDFSELATDEKIPTLTGDEFNSDLPTDNDYTEFDDNEALATDAAGSYIDSNLQPDPDSLPIDAQVTATGSPCLDGNVAINGHSIFISICFDHPWMLRGYAIMKIILIALGYMQTAMLLNKAIVA